MRILSLLLITLITFPAFSAWQLDNQLSSFNFVTIKKGDVGEVQKFTQLAGTVSQNGKVEFTIDLTSVDTKIDIRNERIKKYLFNTDVFPKAAFTTQLGNTAISSIKVGSSKALKVSGEIDLHGQKQLVELQVLVSKLSNKQLVVTSMEPILIKAKSFKLVQGINKLRELAKLPSISNLVPVNFVLTFKQ